MQSHSFHPTSLREYDVRGIIDKTLGEADAEALGRGFGTVVRRSGGSTVAVGYDGRLSSPALEEALVKGLVGTGCTVIRIGLSATPMLYYAVHALNADGGVQITGSHNPPDYNGFKMMLATGPFYGAQIKQLGTMAAAGDWDQGAGSSRAESVFERYVDRLLARIDVPPFAVAWDTGNGAAGPVVEALARRLPGRHVLLNTAVDGTFPAHHPDPTDEHTLEQLKATVAAEKLDFGLAFDGDGDRIGAIDGTGRVVWGDQLLMILAEDLLKQAPGAMIIADVKASQALFDRVAELGGEPLMWKTGHSLIKAKMKQTGAPLAGEMSGHIFYAHDYYGFDDALYAALRLIQAIGRLGGSLTKLRDAMPALVNTPELRFPCAEERKFKVVDEVLARLAQSGATVNQTDGARVLTADGWWLLRASNTQDVLVARAEARDQAALDRLLAGLAQQLQHSGLEIPKGLI
jgi:phosphomannomutase